MLAFPRILARQLWAVLRRAVPRPHGPRLSLLEFQAEPRHLRIRLTHPEIAVEFRQPGAFTSETLLLPLTALGEFEGKGQDPVTLEAGPANQVIARWTDGGVPQMTKYETSDPGNQPAFPEEPERLVRNSPALLQALEEAVQTAAHDSSRYAIHRLLLRGRLGEVIATDGKQLFIQGGYHFPWEEDVLIPRLSIFGCRDFSTDASVEIGRSPKHVVLRIGLWTLSLPIDADARYPQVEQVVPKLGPGSTHWRMAPTDAAFLAHALPRLPGQDDDNKPVTVDLNGRVCLRARAEHQSQSTELVLAQSSFTGPGVRFCVNRQYLARALRLGFDELHVVNPDTPFLAQDNQRTYVAMPLPKEGALAPTDESLRISSADESKPQVPDRPERKKDLMSTPSRNGNGHPASDRKTTPEPEAATIGMSGLITEAQDLKDTLREAFGQANRLVMALRRNRRQSQLVQSTLKSLKQLQSID